MVQGMFEDEVLPGILPHRASGYKNCGRIYSVAIELAEFVTDFAAGLKKVDAAAPQGGSRTHLYRPGVGPLSERETVSSVLKILKIARPDAYSSASPGRYPGESYQCDLLIPGAWAIELKLVRPFYDNRNLASVSLLPASHSSLRLLFLPFVFTDHFLGGALCAP